MMKKSFEKNGMKFVVKYDGSAMIHIYGYEKIIGLWWPTAEDDFWIDEYELIEEGVEDAVNRILKKYGLYGDRQEKLKEYFN